MEEIWKYGRFYDVFKDVMGGHTKNLMWSGCIIWKKVLPLLKSNDFSKWSLTPSYPRGIILNPPIIGRQWEEQVVFIGNRGGYSISICKIKTGKNKQREKSQVLIKGERTSEFESFHLFSSKLDVDKRGNLALSSKTGENDAVYLYNIPELRIVKKYQWDECRQYLFACLLLRWEKDCVQCRWFSAGNRSLYS